LLEAFLTAARRTAEFYQVDGRLATEHALLDDNGDGFGTPADWFRGVRAVKRARDGAAVDGCAPTSFISFAAMRKRNCHRPSASGGMSWSWRSPGCGKKKSQLNEEDYYNRLEVLLLEMANLYERSNDVQKAAPPAQ